MRRYKATEPKYKVPPNRHYVVAVDLGKRKVGVAVALADSCGSQVLGAKTVLCNGGPVAMAHAVVEAAHAMGLDDGKAAGWVWVCEWPVKYKDKRKYHAAIDTLWAVGNALRPKWDEKYTPFQWKGNVPKAANHSRVARALNPDEAALMPPRAEHDAWDAVGILMFALARTRKGGGKI
jgi:hypothetical protein